MKYQRIPADVMRNGAGKLVDVCFPLDRKPAVGLHNQPMHQHAVVHPEFSEEQYTQNTQQDTHTGQDKEKAQKNRPDSPGAGPESFVI